MVWVQGPISVWVYCPLLGFPISSTLLMQQYCENSNVPCIGLYEVCPEQDRHIKDVAVGRHSAGKQIFILNGKRVSLTV